MEQSPPSLSPSPPPPTTSTNEKDDCEIIRWFDAVAENAGKVQRQTLRRILRLNRGVEYLEKWLREKNMKFSEDDDDDDDDENGALLLESIYTSCVPLASHADLEPYIQRIADGDSSPLLTQQPITTLSLSSGTTEGRQKFVPFTRHSAQATLQIFKLAAAYRSRIYPIREGKRILEFIYSSRQYKTKGGLKAGTATTHYFESEEFKIKQQETKSFTCSPPEVISSGDYKQSSYCHLLLGLYYADEVEFVTSTFAYSIIQAFSYFEETWREICEDLREGTLSPRRVDVSGCRESVLRVLRPGSDLASRIQAECEELERRDWFGLIPKLWPNVKYVYSIMTGSMQPYLAKLRHYCGGCLPLVSADYGSTESWIGVNVDPSTPPENVTFAVIPTFAYFEFIPLHRRKSDRQVDGDGDGDSDNVARCLPSDDFLEDDPVPLSKVKVGQQYEVVLTTFTGLYRYRLGDLVEVGGFYKNTPKLNFICRRKLILTVNIDKNTEKDLQLVVERGVEVLSRETTRGAPLVDFTSYADVSKQPGHYVIYWEIKGDVDDSNLVECCREMDASFVDPGYVVSRRTNSIGPLELRIVERGTFSKILEHFIGNGAALSQFKTPRCTTNQVLLRILNRCTVKTFHSTAFG